MTQSSLPDTPILGRPHQILPIDRVCAFLRMGLQAGRAVDSIQERTVRGLVLA